MSIPFNKPYLAGKELEYIKDAILSGKISGNGLYTKKCQSFFENRYGFKKALMTTSCTDALEMAAILTDVKEGDEVIVPSYTFVSSALAFVRQGARIVFADSYATHPDMNVDAIERLITERTKVIVPVHYAGVACEMDSIMQLANKYGVFVVEDAAQSIDSYYKNRPLGGIGHLAAFSFHETKNIIAGEGGLLVINDSQFLRRSEIIWEKGTNRAEFFRGEVNKYGWVDTGSSFLPSELTSAFLYAQLENLERIQSKRRTIWNKYYEGLMPLVKDGYIELPYIPPYATNNGHMFYIICRSLQERTDLIDFLKVKGILSVFHYLSLHKSPYYLHEYCGDKLINSDKYTDCLLRLPLFYELNEEEQSFIISAIKSFYAKR